MAKKGSHQKPHTRISKNGKVFEAGKGTIKPRYWAIEEEINESKKLNNPIIDNLERIITDLTRKIEFNEILLKKFESDAYSSKKNNEIPLYNRYKSTVDDLREKISNQRVDRELYNDQIVYHASDIFKDK